MRTHLLSLVVVASLLWGCREPQAPTPGPAATAAPKVVTPSERVALAEVCKRLGEYGPTSAARPGDFILENSRSLFVVNALDRRLGVFAGGGNVIDATPAGSHADLLRALVFCFDNKLSEQPAWQNLKIVSVGGENKPAAVRVTGRFGKEARVSVLYRLSPSDAALQVEVEITNESAHELRLSPGLAVFCGRTRRFAPPLGQDVVYKSAEVFWLGWTDGRTTYALFDEKGTAWRSRHEPGVSFMRVGRQGILPASTRTWRWLVYVLDGPMSRASDRYWTIRNLPTGQVELQFVDGTTGAGVPGVRVTFGDGRKTVVAAATSDAGGFARCLLPSGQYVLELSAPGRPDIRPFRLATQIGQTHKAAFRVGPASSAACNVVEETEDGRKIPVTARVMVRAADRLTRTPDFGPEWSTQGAGPMLIARDGHVNCPLSSGAGQVGNYTITAFRGPTFSAASRAVQIKPGEKLDVDFVLKRLYKTDPYVAVDCGQRTDASLDGLLPLPERRMLNAADGLDGAVFVEADPSGAALSGPDWLTALDLWIPSVARARCWPLEDARPVADLRAALKTPAALVDLRGLVKTALGAQTMFQADHLADPDQSYFYLKGFRAAPELLPPPGVTCPFDAITILEGRAFLAMHGVQANWFRLLNAGYRVLIVGASGSRGVQWDEGGVPRTYMALRGQRSARGVLFDAAAEFLRTGDGFVSTGPFIRMTVNERPGFGSVVAAKKGEVTLNIDVLAAPRMSLSLLRIYVNGTARKTIKIDAASEEVVRLRQAVTLKLDYDSWVVVEVKGYKGMHVTHLGQGLSAVLPYAVTNPVWLDVDGDGRFTPPIARLRQP